MAKSHTSLLASLIALPLAIGLYGEGTALAQPGPGPGPGPVAQGSSRPIEFPAACSEVKPEAADEARKTFIAGKNKADESSYGEAVTLLVAAYKKDCSRHAFLQIIASVLEKQGKYEDAIVALNLVLERQALTGAERSPIETKIKNLRGLVEEKKKERDAAAAAAAASSSSAARSDAPPANNVAMREHTLPPWLVFGAGTAAVVTGVVLLTVAAVIDPGERCTVSPVAECTLSPTEQGLDPATRSDRLDTYQKNAKLVSGMFPGGVATLIGGVVMMAGGLTWHFLEPTGPATSAKLPKILPSIAPGYGGVSVGGAF